MEALCVVSLASAYMNFTEGTVPTELAIARLNNSVILGTPRFAPQTDDELHTAIWTMWNLLNAQMYHHSLASGRTSGMRWQTGYFREVQARRMVQLARANRVRRYCETGMNAGHSASVVLLANPNVLVHTFDIMGSAWSPHVVQLLNASFPGRFHAHTGRSQVTLPPFVDTLHTQGKRCDLVLVDGGHDRSSASFDLRTFGRASHAGTRFVIDDIQMQPGKALNAEVSRGNVEVMERYGPFAARSKLSPCMRKPPWDHKKAVCFGWGFAVGRYVHPGVAREALL